MVEFARELGRHVQWSDVLDVAIVSTLLYAILVWLRQRASRSLGIAVLATSGTFLLARWLDLYLTAMIFHYGFLGILLTAVIVFQNDIRHGFERLAASTWFRCSPRDDPSQDVAIAITEAVTTMANERIGALIVFPGREPLDRHMRGGATVDAKISVPLLLSIFHPKSPGHDGAVIVQWNRIARLGAHLPLSESVDKVRDSGTRHAAALGLAECSDAIVLAVSEERGTITVGHEGELRIVGPTETADIVSQYYTAVSPGGDSTPRRRFDSWATMLTAITAAISLWFLFAYRTDTVQRTFVVPIEYRNLEANWEIAEPKPTSAQITLSGNESAFAHLDPQAIAVSLDFKDANRSDPIRWRTEPRLTNVPRELNVDHVNPRMVIVSVRPKVAE